MLKHGRIGLFASFQSDGEQHSFFIGKGNTRKFSADEIAIVDECAAWLTSRSEFIKRGSASTASTTEAARGKFYAKIKKA